MSSEPPKEETDTEKYNACCETYIRINTEYICHTIHSIFIDEMVLRGDSMVYFSHSVCYSSYHKRAPVQRKRSREGKFFPSFIIKYSERSSSMFLSSKYFPWLIKCFDDVITDFSSFEIFTHCSDIGSMREEICRGWSLINTI